MAETQQDHESNNMSLVTPEMTSTMTPEEEKEFQIREQVRLRMEAQIQSELKKIKDKVSSFLHKCLESESSVHLIIQKKIHTTIQNKLFRPIR